MSRCLWSLAIYGFALLATQNAYAFRCGNDLVKMGDNKITVVNKCGKPDWIDRWSEDIIDFPDSGFEHRVIRINERWVYNPGPRKFIRIITFNGSTVATLETGGHGFTPSLSKARCDFDIFAIGTNAGEVAARCGEPDAQDQRYVTLTQKIPGGRRQVSVTVDEWTFNLGPTQFIRVLTFRNNNLIKISTGEKGFR